MNHEVAVTGLGVMAPHGGEPDTLFQSLSGRLPEAVGDLWMVQIHGFAPETTVTLAEGSGNRL